MKRLLPVALAMVLGLGFQAQTVSAAPAVNIAKPIVETAVAPGTLQKLDPALLHKANGYYHGPFVRHGGVGFGFNRGFGFRGGFGFGRGFGVRRGFGFNRGFGFRRGFGFNRGFGFRGSRGFRGGRGFRRGNFGR